MNTIALFGGGLGGGEIVIILAVALLLFGSKNLPKVARSLGRAMEEFRRATRQVSNELMTSAEDSDPPRQRPVTPNHDVKPAAEPPKDASHDAGA